MDVNEVEGERLLWGHTTHPETGNQWLPVQQVLGIGHGVDARLGCLSIPQGAVEVPGRPARERLNPDRGGSQYAAVSSTTTYKSCKEAVSTPFSPPHDSFFKG